MNSNQPHFRQEQRINSRTDSAAVLAFITALTACLICIQLATFHAAARAAVGRRADMSVVVADLSAEIA